MRLSKKNIVHSNIFMFCYSLFILFMLYSTEINAIEWGCDNANHNQGTFQRSSDCTMSNSHMEISQPLKVTGINADINNLVTISAATNRRHFYLNNENAKLTLRYLKLIGGNVAPNGASPANINEFYGGSIRINTGGGELNLFTIIMLNNKGVDGGGIYSNSNNKAVINIYGSLLKGNEATGGGGFIRNEKTKLNIYNSTITDNIASVGHGGGIFVYYSDVLLVNSTLSNNIAVKGGGGLYIHGNEGDNAKGPSSLTMLKCTIQNNKQTTSNTQSNDNDLGGGGLIIMNKVTVVLRETSFLSNIATNYLGHEMYFRNNNAMAGTITISSINTNFYNEHFNDASMYNFYEFGDQKVNWIQCGDTWSSRYPDKYAEGQLAGEDSSSTYTLDKAKQKCEKLGPASCTFITCDENSENCALKSSTTLKDSTSKNTQVSYQNLSPYQNPCTEEPFTGTCLNILI
jgi:hypothetical protein